MTRKFILKLISAMRSVDFTENDIIAKKKCTDLIKRRGKVMKKKKRKSEMVKLFENKIVLVINIFLLTDFFLTRHKLFENQIVLVINFFIL
jgi:hypothetical protein